jgi:sulfur-carrier protein
MIRVQLPVHLSTLASVGREVEIQVNGEATLAAVLDELESRYPMLRGTIRDHQTRQRRPFIRYFAVGMDLSHEPPEMLLPEEVAAGKEILRIVGAMAGG